MRHIAANGGKFEADKYLNEYVKFMTTPGSHNDAFASGHHRQFFGNFAGGLQPIDCAETSDKVTD